MESPKSDERETAQSVKHGPRNSFATPESQLLKTSLTPVSSNPALDVFGDGLSSSVVGFMAGMNIGKRHLATKIGRAHV